MVISENTMRLMHRPPAAVPSRYATGWFLTEQEGQPILEHNGILSVYYAEMALLPNKDIGIAFLYNIDSMPAALLVFPQIKSGIISILNHRTPPEPFITVRSWNWLMGVMTLLTLGFNVRSLVHRRRWIEPHKSDALWRLLPHFL